MSKSIFLHAILCVIFSAIVTDVTGQINQFPYKEDFEEPFVLSASGCSKQDCLIEFLPGWFGNEVQKSSRIYADSNSITGEHALGMVPISSFDPTIEIRIEGALIGGFSLNFFASGSKNGGEKDTRPSHLYISVSIDEGLSYIHEVEIDTFRNDKAISYKSYAYLYIPELMELNKIRVKIRSVRSTTGTGQAARVLLDNFTISSNVLAGTAAVAPKKDIYVTEFDESTIYLNERTSGVVYSTTGTVVCVIQNESSISKSNLKKGLYIFKTDSGQSVKIALE